ncbi:stage III sporulation protein AA [Bacillus sp. CGMCC 1.16541]|uniref:stage III sporulation protein AA n=1 Tax=Bacillus sp. CGMCC 1.16541 TaxID=2185143 RepID=UPI000D72DC30|nr:stage III sporulation protein AA [Bacillus sp. CGMCC 1.16541]
MLNEVVQVLPNSIREVASRYIASSVNHLEEIRIRINRPIEFIINSHPYFDSYTATKEDALFILNKLSQFSIYMIEEELRKGYVTIEGGHRVGLAGKVITENGQVKVIRDVTSFNIRVAKEKIGIADRLLPFLYEQEWMNTILIGPPQTGKTTMIRDLARMMSFGVRDKNISPIKVGIVDERSEIAGSVKGVPQHTFGTRLDVLDSCPKAEGMMMMIRSMSPDVIIVDEIGRQEDCDAVVEAVNAGVRVVMTVHGYDIEDLKRRPTLSGLLQLGVFKRFIVLSNENGPGTIKSIYNETHKRMHSQRAIEGGVI